MDGIWLDFERPLLELEKKIEELKATSHNGIGPELDRLTREAEKLKKKIFSNLNRWQRVQLARHPQRPYSMDIIERIAEDFIELHGDRYFRGDPAIIAGIGIIGPHRIAIVAQQKGRTTKERIYRNFGQPHPEGYRKALRIMKLGAKFGLPVLSLVDTPGAYPGVGAEERGQAEAIARNLKEMAVLPVPIVIVVLGEGGSGGALAIAVGDRIYMLEYAIYSVISPEGCASILWRDSSKAPEAAEALKLTAEDLLHFGVIDDIIKEPEGGAHRDWDATAARIKTKVIEAFDELKRLPIDELIQKRVEKFRQMTPKSD
ncbi:acetyl-CoA carboxylase carboxyl transferase subunit alpha [candidate division WOR-3 bacterium]|uniref:Acetyl-coenzyme A carboxylase carboxyl transferase subunit alpha n=1 Tax=candidate division WOR-3 bacterium TaxID=2052148 RepID=A0A660SI73_UNCW3|nr:MAG: acetyl-CoA carboxylase carboxyl transferase subunit alpha [candidate division WOR-3 bacterium]